MFSFFNNIISHALLAKLLFFYVFNIIIPQVYIEFEKS